jgi:competence protein ComEC
MRPARTTQPLLIVLIALGAGIVLDRALAPPAAAGWLAALLACGGWFLLWRREWSRASTLLLLWAVAAAGGAWHHLRWSVFQADDLGRYARPEAEPVCLEAILLSEPSRVPAPPDDPLRTIPGGEMSRLEVAAVALRDGTAWKKVSGRAALLVDGHLLGAHCGDRVRVFAALARPRPARNAGEFDFALHARADRRLCELYCDNPDCVVVLQSGSSWSLTRLLGRLRAGGARLLAEHLPPERAALAATLLLGGRSGASREQIKPFFLTGALHLLVVSGMHVAILAGTLYALLRWTPLPRRAGLVVAGAVVIGYALLTGADPSVVRAATLLVIFYAARYLGRRALARNSWAAGSLVVLALNPAELFRTGPQLSFLAVAVLIWAAERPCSRWQVDPLDRLLAESRPWPVRALRSLGRTLWQVTLVALLVWLATLPLVMLRFHLFSPVAVLLGPLLGPLVTAALVSGFALLLLGWLAPPLGAVCGFICDWSLAGLEGVVAWARDLPGSYFWTPGPSAWWVGGAYATLAVMWAFPQCRPPRRWAVGLLAGWIAVGFGAALRPRPAERLDCTFVAVDHGCAALIQLPSGATLLYDAGRLGAPETGARSIAAVLWSRGLTRLDAVLVSHADADHYNALPELLERFDVGVVYVSPMMFKRRTKALDALRAAIARHGVPIREVWAGDRLRGGGGVKLDILHPPRRGGAASDNANSIVLALEYAGRRILLPGDLEPPGLDDLLATPAYDCDVLLAPHHGSRRSDPPGFAAWSKPECVVVSAGHRPDATVGAAYRKGGARMLPTAERGAVRVVIQPGALKVETFLPRGRP